MSFESKTVEPERSPIDSPCQNVEKGSNDDTLSSMLSWTGVWLAAKGSGYGMHRMVWCRVCFQVFLP